VIAGKSLAEMRVAIIGLGLMGGSLAMALRDSCHSLSGYDLEEECGQSALVRRIVDHVHSDLASAVREVDLLILAVPVGAIISILGDLAQYSSDGAIVLDLGSTKSDILQAMEKMDHRFDPIGGHPMCGKESSSLENADRELFKDAPFALVAAEQTSENARRVAEELVIAVGASPRWMKAGNHDRWVARTSHLPYVLALALEQSVPPDARQLIGPGFRSATRLAESNSSMMKDVLLTNREPVLEALDAFRRRLELIELAIDGGDGTLIMELLRYSAASFDQAQTHPGPQILNPPQENTDA
jgi:prephenate dehydrogenase